MAFVLVCLIWRLWLWQPLPGGGREMMVRLVKLRLLFEILLSSTGQHADLLLYLIILVEGKGLWPLAGTVIRTAASSCLSKKLN